MSSVRGPVLEINEKPQCRNSVVVQIIFHLFIDLFIHVQMTEVATQVQATKRLMGVKTLLRLLGSLLPRRFRKDRQENRNRCVVCTDFLLTNWLACCVVLVSFEMPLLEKCLGIALAVVSGKVNAHLACRLSVWDFASAQSRRVVKWKRCTHPIIQQRSFDLWQRPAR